MNNYIDAISETGKECGKLLAQEKYEKMGELEVYQAELKAEFHDYIMVTFFNKMRDRCLSCHPE